ncbi:Sdd3p [Sporobolomyces salmoneus]|uniref:Sdd3p n=1 Tax=Sporobolomyces salmoneus TaxID=183962 RepID=UPI003171FF2E
MAGSSTTSSSQIHIPDQVGDFKLVTKQDLDFATGVQLAKWESESTGLKVVWSGVEGPLVQGYFSAVTEIFDASGRPHTLEHLVFLGSEKYPYKGVLDTLANRSFATGTNAWTATETTAYTIGTAGSEGFLKILPVFLDHVLYPTITDSGFVTEVFNISGKGEEGGVVFGEMQGREQGSSDLMHLRQQETLYSEKNALRSETGGLLKALRVLKVEEIREYHKAMYVPQNITINVAGRSLDPTVLLETLTKEVLPSIVAHGQNKGAHPTGWIRPFVESSTASNPPKIAKDSIELVPFPEKDESVGELMMSWIGVLHNDFLTDNALEVLGQYLTDSAVSPLYKEFVEIEDPACTDISFYSSTADPTVLTVYLSSVPSEQLDTLPKKFKETLARISKEGIDMSRMATVLERQKLSLLNSMETDGADVLSDVVVADAAYGASDGSDLAKSMKVMADYKVLEGWTAEQWASLLNKFYVDAPALTIVGKPSASLADKVRDDAKAVVDANIKKYGEDGLAKLAKKIEDAQAENDKPIPPEILRDFKIPDVNGIDWIKVETGRSGGVAKEDGAKKGRVQDHLDADAAQLPLFVQYDHINSAFIQISVVLFPENVPEVSPAELRALLPIYLDSFFTLPVTRADGTKLDYEEVVKQLDAETLSYSIDINSPLQEGVTLKIKVPKEKYTKAIAWLSDLLYNSSFSVDRLKISAAKAIQGLPAEKREGSDVSYAAYRKLISEEVSTNVTMNLLNRIEFLPAFAARLKEEPEAVVSHFETFRKGLTHPRAIRVQVKGDVLALEKPVSSWLEHFKAIQPFPASELVPVKRSSDVMGPLGKQPAKKIILYGLSSIESSFAYHVAKGPDSWTHPDQPALTVARAVLNAMEGFLWKWIRGAGLAYGASISHDIESGLISYRIFKSPDSYAAFTAAQSLIDQLVSGKIEIDDLTIESAKSSLAYNTAAKEATISAAANASFTNMLLGLPENHGRIALAATKDVTAEDILRVIKQYIAPIFRPETSIASIASGLAKMDEIATNFGKLGYEVEKRTFDDSDDGSDSGSGSGSESGSESE